MIANRASFWKWFALMLLRPAGFLAFQVLLFGLPNRGINERIYWPVPVILTNLVCVGVMLHVARGKNFDWRCYYLAPFSDNPGMAWLNRWKVFRALPVWVKYPLLAVLVFFLLARPALELSGWISSFVSEGSLPPDAAAPRWLSYAILVLLPIGQVAAEIPWYNSLIFPRLEEAAQLAFSRQFWASTLPAFLISAFGFSIQHAFMPLMINGEDWLRGLTWLPVALMVGIVIRLFPRLTPLVILVHGLMALGVGRSFL